MVYLLISRILTSLIFSYILINSPQISVVFGHSLAPSRTLRILELHSFHAFYLPLVYSLVAVLDWISQLILLPKLFDIENDKSVELKYIFFGETSSKRYCTYPSFIFQC